MRKVCLLAVVTLACWGFQRGEGRHPQSHRLSQTISITTGKLKIIADGPVVARGHRNRGASVSIRSSRDQSGEPSLRTFVKGPWTVFQVFDTAEFGGAPLQVSVPESLAELAINSGRGSIEVYDFPGSIGAETRSGRIQLDRIGGNARVVTGGGPVRIGYVQGSLRCTSGGGTIQVDRAGGETWCETAGGEIYIGEAGGPVHATTAGNIQIGRAHSSVTARSGGGLIGINEAGGVVTAETAGGSIEVGPSKGVSCESAAGAIRVKAVGGPLRAYTASGNILAEFLPGVKLDDSILNTARGDITVFIPSNISVSIQALNQAYVRGRIVSDFPEIRVRNGGDRRGPVVAEGSLNGGGPVLRISAAGSIYLRRQK